MKPFSHILQDQEFPILQAYLTPGSKRRPGPGFPLSPGVKFIVAHDTGNSGSTARANVRYYENTRNEKSASAHIFVDDNQIIECIPALTNIPEKAWHVLYDRREDNIRYGFNSNDAAIGIEYCYGKNINSNEAYRRYVWVIAYSCWKFNLDPKGSIIGHHKLDPSRKTDPVTGLSQSRRSYSQLLKDIVEFFQQGGGILLEQPIPVFPRLVEPRGVLNIRKGEPYRRASVSRQVKPGEPFEATALVLGEFIDGIDQWYDLGTGEYCWSGAAG